MSGAGSGRAGASAASTMTVRCWVDISPLALVTWSPTTWAPGAAKDMEAVAPVASP